MPDSIVSTAIEVLGGYSNFTRPVETGQDLEAMATLGLPSVSLFALADRFGDDVAESLLVDGSRHIRHLNGAPLSTADSRSVARGALLLAHALAVFGDASAVQRWLRSNIASLKHQRPVDLLAKGEFELVDETLVRIEHGVFS